MNILKTSALAAILALSSFSASASTNLYTANQNVILSLELADAMTLTFDDASHTIDNLVYNDKLDRAILTYTMESDGDRSIGCVLEEDGSNNTVSVAGSKIDVSNTISSNLQVSFSNCEAGTSKTGTINIFGDVTTQEKVDDEDITFTLAITYSAVRS